MQRHHPFLVALHRPMALMILAGLTALHIAAALFHQIILQDHLLRRMWFGNRQQ